MVTLLVTLLRKGKLWVLIWEFRIMDIFLFVFGVFTFSFSIGSMGSLLTGLDTKKAKLKEKIQILNELRQEYKIPFLLYHKLYRAFKYDHTK